MMARASGLRFFMAEMTSRPLPSPSRMSTTAKAGGAFSTCNRPSATDSAVVTAKPRPSMARARRCRNDLSSSTISSERSPEGGTGVAPGTALFIATLLRGGCNSTPQRFASRRRHEPQAMKGRNRSTIKPDGELHLRTGDGRLKRGRREGALKIGAIPGHGDCRAMQRRCLIDQRKSCPGAFQERFGDEEPQAQPKHGILVTLRSARSRPPVGDIGRADAVHDLRRKAGTVVSDGDAYSPRRPLRQNLDPPMGEVDRVLDQIAETVADRWIAGADGFVRAVGGKGDANRDAKIS